MSRAQYVHSRRAEPEIGPEWISIGVIVGAVGVKGAVRLKVFTEDLEALLVQGNVTIFPDQHSQGEQRDCKLLHKIKVGYAVQIAGVSDRDQAEVLKGLKLYVSRENLPEIEEAGSYYYEDMEGLQARELDGKPFGIVQAVYNFGAGDLVEVKLDDAMNSPASGTRMYPFRDEFVPQVNIEKGYLVIDRAAYGEELKTESGQDD